MLSRHTTICYQTHLRQMFSTIFGVEFGRPYNPGPADNLRLFLSASRSLSSRNVIVFVAGPVLGVTDLPERAAPDSSTTSNQDQMYEKTK